MKKLLLPPTQSTLKKEKKEREDRSTRTALVTLTSSCVGAISSNRSKWSFVRDSLPEKSAFRKKERKKERFFWFTACSSKTSINVLVNTTNINTFLSWMFCIIHI